MKIVIAGGSGFLGRPLASALARDGHEIVTLTRRASAKAEPSGRSVAWTPNGALGPWAAEIDGAGAIVNLAGESIAGKRWTKPQKARILESRVLATRSLVTAIAAARTPPPVFVSGSAVGYYGPLGEEVATEDRPAGTDFLATVCQAWEAEATKAGHATRVTCVRTGIVLERDGGALPKMLPPFWFGAGGPVGSGRQYWPWVHRTDWVDLVRWIIQTGAISGPINVTSPHPVTNAVFAKALGRALRRPAVLPTPGFALKLLLGEMAESLLLSGQRAVPAKAERFGYRFTYQDLDEALRAILKT
jgi:uncharacterized protein (TIGR01777 family)